MVSQQTFDEYARKVKDLKSQPSDQEKLKLYGFYKQATDGDIQTVRPGIMDPVGRAKWDAWNACKGISRSDAMEKYSVVAQRLVQKYGVN